MEVLCQKLADSDRILSSLDIVPNLTTRQNATSVKSIFPMVSISLYTATTCCVLCV